jgi:hypothetical protein
MKENLVMEGCHFDDGSRRRNVTEPVGGEVRGRIQADLKPASSGSLG